jgi:hypothetical protein
MTVTQWVKGVCARAYSPQGQAGHPLINVNIVIKHSKSPDAAVASMAAQNLVARIKGEQLEYESELLFGLLTHPAVAVSSAVVDYIIEHGRTIPGDKYQAFVAALKASGKATISDKLAKPTFPPYLLIEIASDSDADLAAKAFAVVRKKVMDRTFISPLVLSWMDKQKLVELMLSPDFNMENRAYVLFWAIRVRIEREQGWEHVGSGLYWPGGPTQTRRSLVDHELATTLLRTAINSTAEEERHLLLDQVKKSGKLGEFFIYVAGEKGRDSWQFSPKTLKDGPDLVYQALGPGYPSSLDAKEV